MKTRRFNVIFVLENENTFAVSPSVQWELVRRIVEVRQHNFRNDYKTRGKHHTFFENI